jgi:hypothetical protein
MPVIYVLTHIKVMIDSAPAMCHCHLLSVVQTVIVILNKFLSFLVKKCPVFDFTPS